jgi:hypothetical protein
VIVQEVDAPFCVLVNRRTATREDQWGMTNGPPAYSWAARKTVLVYCLRHAVCWPSWLLRRGVDPL